MTFRRKVVSAFIVWHLAAIGVSSLPTSPRVDRAPNQSGVAFPRTTLAFDRIGAYISRAASAVTSLATRVAGKPIGAYITITGLAQQWAMFSNPPQFDRYWRVRYYVQPAKGKLWMATELIGPTHAEDRVRIVKSYRDSYRDKAFEIAHNEFVKRRKASVIGPGTRPGDLPDALAPIGRYFARRFAQTRLRDADERIVRTELWFGAADNKPFGQPLDEQALVGRRAALLGYSEGPVEDRLRVRPYPPYHGVEEEADIKWLLEYFEES